MCASSSDFPWSMLRPGTNCWVQTNSWLSSISIEWWRQKAGRKSQWLRRKKTTRLALRRPKPRTPPCKCNFQTKNKSRGRIWLLPWVYFRTQRKSMNVFNRCTTHIKSCSRDWVIWHRWCSATRCDFRCFKTSQASKLNRKTKALYKFYH